MVCFTVAYTPINMEDKIPSLQIDRLVYDRYCFRKQLWQSVFIIEKFVLQEESIIINVNIDIYDLDATQHYRSQASKTVELKIL